MNQDPAPRYIHRELSWLAFNERVLEEAADRDNPLLERLKFLAIFSSNLDEFFMVRVANTLRLLESGYNRRDRFGYFPQDLYRDIKERTRVLMKQLYDIYEGVGKELTKNQIFLKRPQDLTGAEKSYVKSFFETTLFPIMTPLGVDQGHPFPVLPSKSLAFAVRVRREQTTHLAILAVPNNIARAVKLPSGEDEHGYILIEEIIRKNLKHFFRGYTIEDAVLFRFLRDSELSVDEDDQSDLLQVIENQVKKRSRAKVVYMETEHTCPKELLAILCQGLDYPQEEVFSIASTMDFAFFFQLNAEVDRPQLRYRGYSVGRIEYDNIFERIKEGNFITHLPFQSFYPTVDLIRTAARDKDVLAIKMTLYRTNEDSAIIQALKNAAENKKQVTVVVELKARFDEEQNINWAKELEGAGCHVVYGYTNLKIHAKMTLIVRKEEGRIVRYVNLSTGNYNEKTARIYTDIGFFTVNDDYAKDISDIFNVITGYSMPLPWKRLISAPNDLRSYFFELVDREIAYHKQHKNGRIFAKMNALEDIAMVDKLYEAAAAGVQIDLVVRGICCLIPGVKGLSETIRIKSVVGRFLEHTRIFSFHNNGSPRVFLASADWMTRNFDRRIEILFEVLKPELKEHLLDILEIYWKDSQKSRYLQPDYTYQRPKGKDKMNAQEYLLNSYHEAA